MSCETIQVDLAAYADGELTGDGAAQVATHLAECAECAELLELLCGGRDAARELSRLPAPAGFLAGVHARIDAELGIAPPAPLTRASWGGRSAVAAALLGVMLTGGALLLLTDLDRGAGNGTPIAKVDPLADDEPAGPKSKKAVVDEPLARLTESQNATRRLQGEQKERSQTIESEEDEAKTTEGARRAGRIAAPKKKQPTETARPQDRKGRTPQPGPAGRAAPPAAPKASGKDGGPGTPARSVEKTTKDARAGLRADKAPDEKKQAQGQDWRKPRPGGDATPGDAGGEQQKKGRGAPDAQALGLGKGAKGGRDKAADPAKPGTSEEMRKQLDQLAQRRKESLKSLQKKGDEKADGAMDPQRAASKTDPAERARKGRGGAAGGGGSAAPGAEDGAARLGKKLAAKRENQGALPENSKAFKAPELAQRAQVQTAQAGQMATLIRLELQRIGLAHKLVSSKPKAAEKKSAGPDKHNDVRPRQGLQLAGLSPVELGRVQTSLAMLRKAEADNQLGRLTLAYQQLAAGQARGRQFFGGPQGGGIGGRAAGGKRGAAPSLKNDKKDSAEAPDKDLADADQPKEPRADRPRDDEDDSKPRNSDGNNGKAGERGKAEGAKPAQKPAKVLTPPQVAPKTATPVYTLEITLVPLKKK